MENSKLSLLLSRLEAKENSEINDGLTNLDDALSKNITAIYSIGANSGCAGNSGCTGNTGCSNNTNCTNNTTCTWQNASSDNKVCKGHQP